MKTRAMTVGINWSILLLALVGVPSALVVASPIGVFTRTVSDVPGDPAEVCDILLGKDVDVCHVFVQFDNPDDKLHVVGLARVVTDAPGGFVQVLAGQIDEDLPPDAAAITFAPELVCDSFVTIGRSNSPAGLGECGAVAPDFDSAAFRTSGQLVGSWYCENPSSQQGLPAADLSMLVAQLTVPAGAAVSGEISIFYNTGTDAPFTASFECVRSGPLFQDCLQGPVKAASVGCDGIDFDGDDDVDLQDFAEFQETFRTTRGGNLTLVASTATATVDNQCVPDVDVQFRALDSHGDAMGYHLGRFSGDTECFDDCDYCMSHYQGIVRKPGAGVPFFYVSKNNGPEILVVQMGSRDLNGERLRSNRFVRGSTTEFTLPPFVDGEIATAAFPYFEFLNDSYGLDHVGGMQAIGDTLVASVEGDGPLSDILNIRGASVFLDLSNPAFPFAYHTEFFPHPNGSNAIARLNDGRYLLLVSGGGNFAYVSNVSNLRDPNLSFQFVGELNARGAPFGYNHISLVKQCDDALYLIGTDRFVGPCAGPLSTAYLWRVDLEANLHVPGSISVTPVGSKDLNCNNVGEGVTCDFRAAGGTYVSPSGELIIYGTVHQRGNDFTAFAEFRRRDVLHPNAQPWVQLYSDPLGWNSPFGQSITLDMPDRYKDDFLNLGLMDFFDNSASSVRWWAPVGCCMELIANPCTAGSTGAVFPLEGTGQVEIINNLAEFGFGDIASAVRFCFDAVEPFGCNPPLTVPSSKCQGCPADVNNDCYVDMSDLAQLLAGWGEGGGTDDINSDGIVNIPDLAELLGSWGRCYDDGPDLVISNIHVDNLVHVGQPLAITFELSNIGLEPAFGFMNVGFSFSIDNNPNNSGDDIGLGVLNVNLNPPLQPGEKRPYLFNTSVPILTPTLQNLFVCTDLGGPPCGAICEGCEYNNCSSVDVMIGQPDLAVANDTVENVLCLGDSLRVCGTMRNNGLIASSGAVQVGAWLSLDGNPFNGNGDEIQMGGLCGVDANLQPELDKTPFCFDSLLLPVDERVAMGMQSLTLCVDTTGGCGGSPPCSWVCETNEFNNCDTVPIRIAGPDAAVVDLSFPSPVRGPTAGFDPVPPTPVTVTVENRGCGLWDIPVDVCMGSNCAPRHWFNDVPPGAIRTATIDVIPPLTGLNCGGAESVPVMACTKLDVDVVDGNNCQSENISVVEQYWDLDLAISSGDNSVGLGDTFSYSVVVTNRGNEPSPSQSCVAFITGINCLAGPGEWGCVLVGDPFTPIGVVQPGQNHSKTFRFQFTIPSCCAPPINIGQQWLKAEILYTQGENCDDDCGEGFGNNLHREPIQITP